MQKKWITYNWSLAHSILMLFLIGSSLCTSSTTFLTVGALLSGLIYVILNRQVFTIMQPFGGYANWITFFRMGLLVFVGVQFQNLHYLTICCFFIINILLDIADGMVARKYNTSSEFGLYLDMELDAFYVCLTTLILYFEGLTAWWIICIGLLRYVYTFLFVLLNVELITEPKQKFASLAAGTLFWCLLLPFFNSQLNIILGLVSAVIVFSFVQSFLFQINCKQ